MRTVLSAVVVGNGLWRVEITWPNGSKSHYGKFLSEIEAVSWIVQHRWLTEREIVPQLRNRPKDSAKKPKPDFPQRD
jgi:hypothetical protein